MFKVPNKDDFPFMVDAYKKMSSEAKKVCMTPSAHPTPLPYSDVRLHSF